MKNEMYPRLICYFLLSQHLLCLLACTENISTEKIFAVSKRMALSTNSITKGVIGSASGIQLCNFLLLLIIIF